MSNKIKVSLQHRKSYPHERGGVAGTGPVHEYKITKIIGSPTVLIPNGDGTGQQCRVGDIITEGQAEVLSCQHEVITTEYNPD